MSDQLPEFKLKDSKNNTVHVRVPSPDISESIVGAHKPSAVSGVWACYTLPNYLGTGKVVRAQSQSSRSSSTKEADHDSDSESGSEAEECSSLEHALPSQTAFNSVYCWLISLVPTSILHFIRSFRDNTPAPSGIRSVRPLAGQIILYSEPDCAGRSVTLTESTPILGRLDFNDTARSARVVTGKWRLYQHYRYGGDHYEAKPSVYSPIPCLNRNLSSVEFIPEP
jgi:hypothetical protein